MALSALVVLIALLWLYLRDADLSIYEEQITAYVSGKIGHRLEIDGQFELGLGRFTRLTADGIVLTNTEWPGQPVIARVGHLLVVVDTWSLFSGPPIVEDLDVRDVEVTLERDADLNPNWMSAVMEAAADVEGSDEFDPNLVVLRDVDASAIHIRFISPTLSKPIDIAIEHARVKLDMIDMLDIDVKGIVNQYPLSIDGSFGPRSNLLDGRNLVCDLEIAIGLSSLKVTGTAEDLLALEGVEARFSLQGPSIDRVANTLGFPAFAEGPFRIGGVLQRRDGGKQLDLEGNIGQISVVANGTADRLLRPSMSELNFDIAGPDTSNVAEVFGIIGAPEAPFKITGNLRQAASRWSFSGIRVGLGENAISVEGWIETGAGFPDGELAIDAAGPDISVIGPFLELTGLPNAEFDIDGRVQKYGKNWRFNDVEATVGPNRLQVSGSISDDASTEIVFSARGPDTSVFAGITGLEGLPPRPFEVSARIQPHTAGIRVQDARASVGGNHLDMDGVIATASDLIGTQLKISGGGPELGNVALLTGVPYLPSGPFEFAGSIGIDKSGVLVDEFSASVSQLRATMKGHIGLGSDSGNIDLAITASGDDVADLAAIEWLQRLSGEPFSVSGGMTLRNNRIDFNTVRAKVSDVEIDLDGDVSLATRDANIVFAVIAEDTLSAEKLLSIGSLPRGKLSAGGGVAVRQDALEFSDFNLSLADNVLEAHGTLSLSPLTNDSDLQFSASGTDINALMKTFGVEMFASKPFKVAAQVTGTPSGFAARDFAAEIGDNDLEGTFAVDLSEKPRITARLASRYLDIAGGQLAGLSNSEDNEKSRIKEPVFSHDPLSTEWLDLFDADVVIAIDRMIVDWVDARDIRIGLKLEDRALTIAPVIFRESRGGLDGQLSLIPSQEEGVVELVGSLEIQDVRPGLLPEGETDRSILPAFNGTFAIEGTGASIHQIMASSNGKISIRQGSGRLRNSSSMVFGDVILTILRTINPLQTKNQYRTIECGIYEVDIEEGVANLTEIALQSNILTLIASGRIKFDTEVIDLSVRSMPREGLGISIGGLANSFFKLGGTLRSPQVMIDTKSSATTTGAAVATGGLSLLAKGLFDRMSGSADICAKLNADVPDQASDKR